jgi:hypothetical protein
MAGNINTGNSVFPLPIDTPISDDSKYVGIRFGMVWNRFFKAISDMLLRSRMAMNAEDSQSTRGFKYVTSGCAIFCTWVQPSGLVGDVVVSLPFPALLPFDIGATIYPAGTNQITILNATTYVRFWYVANLEAKGA